MMSELLAAIDVALEEKGLSDAAASRLAVGHPSFIKNLRLSQTRNKQANSFDSLQALCDVLDLEFYVGPPRIPADVDQRLVDDSYAMVKRYNLRLSAGPGLVDERAEQLSPVAFRLPWLQRHGLSPDFCSIVTIDGDSMMPTLFDGDMVLIDERHRQVDNKSMFAFSDTEGELRVKRLQIAEGALVLRSDNPDFEVEIRTAHDVQRMQIIGRVKLSVHDWS